MATEQSVSDGRRELSDDDVIAALAELGPKAKATDLCEALVKKGYSRQASQLAMQRATDRGGVQVNQDWTMSVAPKKGPQKLSNEELGQITRKFRDITRRIEEGTLDLPQPLRSLQNVAEGKTVPQVVHAGRAKPQAFKKPKEKDRKRSLGAKERRLSRSLTRLEWPQQTPEHIIVELWEAECIPSWGVCNGRTYVDAILDEQPDAGRELFYGPPALNDRDVQVVNSTIQWLGTNIGICFLRKFFAVSQILVD